MSKRILVVEDDEDSRRILRDLLASADYQMLEAEDGKHGIAVAEALIVPPELLARADKVIE